MLKTTNLCFTYPDGKQAINNINIELNNNETVGLIGANGAGKTTFLHTLVGLYLPSEGAVEVDGIQLSKKNLEKIRSKVAYLFQNSDDQLFMNTIYEDVAFGPRSQGLSETEVETITKEALTKVNMLTLMNARPYRLSSGQKKSAAIASLLSMRPKLLIMDEPTNSLDPKQRRNLITLLNGFDEAKLIATHDLDFVLDTCERVLIMKDGKLVADGKAVELLSNTDLMEECSLEVPYRLQ